MGLILIVFESGLDLVVSRKKLKLTGWAFSPALGILIITNLVIALIFQIVGIELRKGAKKHTY